MDARGIYLPTQKNNTKRHIEAPPSPSHWAPNIDPGFATVSASKLTQILQGDVEGFWGPAPTEKRSHFKQFLRTPMTFWEW